jgi:DNA-binding CsgD family transcriptional regulator
MPRSGTGLPTPREVDALRLLANGHTLRSAGRVLGIGRSGVASLLVDAYRRLGVHDRAHAVAVALALGLIGLDEVRLPETLRARQEPADAACRPRAERNSPEKAREGP